MKYNKSFLLGALSIMTVTSLVACAKSQDSMNDWTYDPEAVYEIGDTVKEWKSEKDLKTSPLQLPDEEDGVSLKNDFGHEDKSSLYFKTKNDKGYITSNLGKGNSFFTDLDVKNGDNISLYVYVPGDSNLASLELELLSIEYSAGGWHINI